MGDDVVALGEDDLVFAAERCAQSADEAEEALAAGRDVRAVVHLCWM